MVSKINGKKVVILWTNINGQKSCPKFMDKHKWTKKLSKFLKNINGQKSCPEFLDK